MTGRRVKPNGECNDVNKNRGDGHMDIRLEVVLPAADMQQARDFYGGLGWRVSSHYGGEGDFRVVQLTPQGSRESELSKARPADSTWLSRAACRSVDPDLFFPVSATGSSVEQAARAKAVCAKCPARLECLVFALRTGQAHGVWGGLTEEERSTKARSGRWKAPRESGENRANSVVTSSTKLRDTEAGTVGS